MTVSSAGLAFIARFEGYRRYVYDDGAGWATIGIGHLLLSLGDTLRRGCT